MTEIEQFAKQCDQIINGVDLVASELRRHAFSRADIAYLCHEYMAGGLSGCVPRSGNRLRLACQHLLFDFYPELL